MLRRLLISGGGSAVPGLTGPYKPTEAHAVTVLTEFHCHTNQSDGTQTPAQIVAHYLGAGFGALMITDHDMVTAQPAGITTAISGNETSPSTQHIISINTSYTRGGLTDAQAILDGIEAAGGHAEIAHPNWPIGMSYSEMAALSDNWLGLEIHNAGVVIGGGVAPGSSTGYAIALWDQLLTGVRRDIWGFSVDDLHWITFGEVWDQGRVKIFAAANTVTDLMEATVAGRFVADASNHGVTPGYPNRRYNGVELTCAGATRMEVYGTGGALLATELGDTIDYEYTGSEYYVRLVAVGEYSDAFGSALSDRYYAVSGSWATSGGQLVLTAPGTAAKLLLVRKQVERSFAAQVDITLPGSTNADAGNLLFYTRLDADYFYAARIGGNADPTYDDHLVIFRRDTTDTLIDSAVFVPTPGVSYTVKVDVDADGLIQAKVWEVGTSEPGWMCSATDTTWRDGGFGLRGNANTGNVLWDNLYIDGLRTYYQPIPVG